MWALADTAGKESAAGSCNSHPVKVLVLKVSVVQIDTQKY